MTKTFKRIVCAALSATLAVGPFAHAQEYTVRLPVAPTAYSTVNQTIDFGNVLIGGSASRVLTVRNTSSEPLTITSVTSAGKPVALTNQTCTAGKELKPNEFCTFTATLTPLAAGRWDSVVSVAHTGAAVPDQYTLKSYGLSSDAVLQVTPAALDFGPISLMVASPTRTVTVRNQGEVEVELIELRLAENTLHYSLDGSGCETLLAPGDSCDVTLRFTPRLLGAISTRVTAELGDGTVVHTLSATGAGVQGVPVFSTSTLNFNNAAVGVTSAPLPVTLFNTGTGPFNILSLVASGEGFAIQNSTCGTTLAAGAYCVVNLTTTPVSSSQTQGFLTLDASGTAIRTHRVQLFSMPVQQAPALEVLPSPLDFADVSVGQSKTQSLTIRSTGTVAATVSGYAFKGPQAADFSLVNAASCTGSLEPGMECVLDIRVTPQATGLRSANLAMATNLSNPEMLVPLTAQGRAGVLTAAPSPLALTATPVGQSTSTALTLRNTGDASLQVTGVTPEGAVATSLSTTECVGATLAPAASCVVTVNFSAQAAQAYSGQLRVAHTGLDGVLLVPVTAEGLPALVGVPVLDPFTCTPQPAATGSTVTCVGSLRNTGTASLTVNSLSRTGTAFSAPTGCSAPLAPAQSCAITLSANSATAQTLNTSVSVDTSAGVESRTVSTNWLSPQASLSTTAHGSVNIGQSNVRTHTVTNTGSFAVSVTLPATLSPVSGLSFAGTPGGNACVNGMSLAVGASCNLATTCTPTAAGALNATLSVATSAGVLSAPVTCSGSYPPASGEALQISPNPIDMGNVALGQTGSRAVTVTNTQLSPIKIDSLSFSGSQASEFALQSNTCTGLTLAQGASCTVTVRGTPSVVGQRSTSLVLSTDAASQPTPVTVLVTGAQGSLSLNPASVAFDDTIVGQTNTKSVVLTNNGTASMNIGAVTVGSGLSTVVTTSGCASQALAAGASCTMILSFKPTAATAYSGTLTIAHNGTGSSTTLNLSGAGLPVPVPGASVSTGADCNATVSFGRKANCDITVTSNGQTALVISGYQLTRTAGDYLNATQTAANASAFTALAGGATYNSSTGQLTLPVGASARLSLTALPQAAGVSASTTASPLAYQSLSGVHTTRVALTNTAGVALSADATFRVSAPALTAAIDPTTRNLQQGQSGTYSATVTNQGAGSVKFATALTGTASPSALTVLSGTASWLAQGTPSCTAASTLASGQTCTQVLTCTPSAVNQSVNARLTWQTAVEFERASDTVNYVLPQTLNFSCAGVGANLSVSTLSPGATTVVATGSQSGNWKRLSNNGVGPVTLSSLNPPSGVVYYVENGNSAHCNVGSVIQPSQACDFAELVTATNASATPLTVASTAGYVNTSAGTVSVPANYSVLGVSVTGSAPATVQKGESRDITLTVTNASPSAASDFTFTVGTYQSVASQTCTNVAPSATCSVVLRLSVPDTATGTSLPLSLGVSAKFARILNTTVSPAVASSNAGIWSASVSLSAPSGSVVASAHPATLVGAQSSATHTLTNTGQGALTITGVSVGTRAGLTLSGNNCPAQLNAGQSCTATTQYAPLTMSQSTGQINFVTSAGTLSASIALPTVTADWLAPNRLDFGDVNVGSTSPVQKTVLTNGHSGSLSFTLALPAGVVRNTSAAGSCASTATFTLASGASCDLSFSLTNITEGVIQREVQISTSVQNLTLTLVGQGVVPIGSVTLGYTACSAGSGAEHFMGLDINAQTGAIFGDWSYTKSVNGGYTQAYGAGFQDRFLECNTNFGSFGTRPAVARPFRTASASASWWPGATVDDRYGNASVIQSLYDDASDEAVYIINSVRNGTTTSLPTYNVMYAAPRGPEVAPRLVADLSALATGNLARVLMLEPKPGAIFIRVPTANNFEVKWLRYVPGAPLANWPVVGTTPTGHTVGGVTYNNIYSRIDPVNFDILHVFDTKGYLKLRLSTNTVLEAYQVPTGGVALNMGQGVATGVMDKQGVAYFSLAVTGGRKVYSFNTVTKVTTLLATFSTQFSFVYGPFLSPDEKSLWFYPNQQYKYAADPGFIRYDVKIRN